MWRNTWEYLAKMNSSGNKQSHVILKKCLSLKNKVKVKYIQSLFLYTQMTFNAYKPYLEEMQENI